MSMGEIANYVVFVGGISALAWVILTWKKPDWSQQHRILLALISGNLFFIGFAFFVGGVTKMIQG